MVGISSATKQRFLQLVLLVVVATGCHGLAGSSRLSRYGHVANLTGTDLGNTSNQSPQCSLSFNPESDECARIHELCDNVTCRFVTEADSCSSEAAILPYFRFLYCTMPVNLIPLSMVILFLWLIFLFIFLGTTADEYFCPSLIVMSQLLKLNQNLAGVTLLALGNGAPDIFSAFAAITQADNGNAGLAIGALFGAGMFVTTIVTGAVSIYKPFTLTQRPFMRDVIFYIFAVYLTFFVLWTNTVELYQAIIFVLMYILYVLVVFVGRLLYQKVIKKRILGKGDIPRPPPKQEGEEMTHGTSGEHNSDHDEETEEDEELNTESKPLIGPKSNVNINVATSPSLHDTTPLLVSSDQHHNYSTIANSTQPRTDPGLDSGVQTARTNRLHKITEEEDEGGLTISLPTSLSPPPEDYHLQKGAARSYRHIPVTDADDDDDDIYQAKLLAMQKEARRKRKIRRTISGALDITEDVGVAILGSENLSKVCDHVPPTPQPSTPRASPRSSIAPGLPSVSQFLAALRDTKAPKTPHPFWKMLKAIWPLGEEFKSLRWYYKIVEIAKIPSCMLLALTVPVVDYDEDDQKWNRWLNIMHCVSGPLTMSLLIQLESGPLGLLQIGGVLPVWTLVLCVGIVLALIVTFTSKDDNPPKYHGPVFALLGFVSAIIWIYVVANEIVALLQAIGIVLSMSDAVLGLTLLAWGNSIGDAISNFTMAKQGFPRMAISACFGGPLLNMLIGVGVASIVKSLQSGISHSFQINFTRVELVSGCFLMFSLVFQLVAALIMRFKMRRLYGVILIGFYLTFLLLAILTEVNVIPIKIPGVITA